MCMIKEAAGGGQTYTRPGMTRASSTAPYSYSLPAVGADEAADEVVVTKLSRTASPVSYLQGSSNSSNGYSGCTQNGKQLLPKRY